MASHKVLIKGSVDFVKPCRQLKASSITLRLEGEDGSGALICSRYLPDTSPPCRARRNRLSALTQGQPGRCCLCYQAKLVLTAGWLYLEALLHDAVLARSSGMT